MTTKTMTFNKLVVDTVLYPNIKEQILCWISQFSICSFLDNHHYSQQNPGVECIAAAEANTIISGSLLEVDRFIQEKKSWLFGHLNYNYQQVGADSVGFAPFFFFQPKTILTLSGTSLVIETLYPKPADIFQEIISSTAITNPTNYSVSLQATESSASYINSVQILQDHIRRGDCYEINYCQEFYAADVHINGLSVYKALSEVSPVPFACYYKNTSAELICASPERFLKKTGQHLLSQPIKGTIKRQKESAAADDELKQSLLNSAKDRSENVMVVDMVRNDLSRVCEEGSVLVEELFGIYSFPQVHQMISSISGRLKRDTSFSEIIHATYPMGSMTGAPKKRVVELIETYEKQSRGLFSGTVGYINPEGDFDFNVVIRSIFYNNQTKFLRYLVGSGITIYSDPAAEYDECMLKAEAMKSVLGS